MKHPGVLIVLTLAIGIILFPTAYLHAASPKWKRQRTLVRIPLPERPGVWMAEDVVAALPDGALKAFHQTEDLASYAVGHDGTDAYLLSRRGGRWRLAAKVPLGSRIEAA